VLTAPGGLGKPSSVTVPSRTAPEDNVTAWSGPALTAGDWFTGVCDDS
jgi:hypothetical protein